MKPYIAALALAAVLAAVALNRPARASEATCDPDLPLARYDDCVQALRAAAIAQLGITNAPTPEPYSRWETQADGAQVRFERPTSREPVQWETQTPDCRGVDIDGCARILRTRPSGGVPVEVERRDRSGQRRTYAKPTPVPPPVETPTIVSANDITGYAPISIRVNHTLTSTTYIGRTKYLEYVREHQFRCGLYADGSVTCVPPDYSLPSRSFLLTQAEEDEWFPGPGAEWFGRDHPCNTDNYRDEPRCKRAPGHVYSPGHIPEPYYDDREWIYTCDAVAEDGSCQTWSRRQYADSRPPADKAWTAAYACVDRRETLPSGLVREWRDCQTPLGPVTTVD